MRLLCLLPVLLFAACAPRAVLGHGGHAPTSVPEYGTPSGTPAVATMPNAAPIAGANLYADPVDGVTLLDTPITVVSAVSAGSTTSNASTGSTTVSAGTTSSVGEPPSGVVISRLPAPHRVAAADAPLPRTVADAVALLGHRDPRDPLAFAFAVATALTSRPAPPVTDGPTLVAWARELGMWSAPASMTRPGGEATTGDLLVFDRAVEKAPASLVAVVLATDDRGVISFLYLARGVIRIGHVDPTRPIIARDRERRVVNSYIRHTTDHPPAGTRYLAGELLAGAIHIAP